MGIETSADHEGAECGFTSAIIVIEGELRVSHLPLPFSVHSKHSIVATLTCGVSSSRAKHNHPPSELAKIDPSVSVLCDVHNTLVNTVIRTYGTKELQDKYLPSLSTSKVRRGAQSRQSAARGCETCHALLR